MSAAQTAVTAHRCILAACSRRALGVFRLAWAAKVRQLGLACWVTTQYATVVVGYSEVGWNSGFSICCWNYSYRFEIKFGLDLNSFQKFSNLWTE
jgi:hypothetical protein